MRVQYERLKRLHSEKNYYFVIQTTVGRKNLDDIKDVLEILRFALDDKMMWKFFFDILLYFFLEILL